MQRLVELISPKLKMQDTRSNIVFFALSQTLGNHEFDHGIMGVVPFMEEMESPIVVANIDDSDEPTFQGKYQSSIVIDRYERKIGVIGIILGTVDVST